MGFRSLIAFFFSLILFSCSENKPKDETAEKDYNPFVSPKVTPDSVSKKDTVLQKKDSAPEDSLWPFTAQVFFNTSYCGGAAPTQEILDACKKQRPLCGSTIRFVPVGKTGKEYFAKTDKSGNLSVSLPGGNWQCFLTTEIDPSTGVKINCQEWFKRSFGSVFIKNGRANSGTMLFELPCDPCDPAGGKRP